MEPFTQVDIPSMANWMYVSDSFSLSLSTPNVTLHAPGPANQSLTIPPNTPFKVYATKASLTVMPISQQSGNGINTDLMLGLYDVVNLVNGKPKFIQVIPFIPPYGTAANGVLMNSVSSLFGQVPTATRNFGEHTPVLFGMTTPASPSNSQYQIGGYFQFNYAVWPITTIYEYHIQAAIVTG